MTNHRRIFIAASALVLAACASTAPPPPLTETTLRVNVFAGATNLPLLAAISKGFMRDRKLTIEIQNTPDSDQQRAGLAAGRFEIALAAIDIALWDIKGKALGQPVWRLLGGARDRVPLYATFGFAVFDREQLAEAARLWVWQGFQRLKMVVGHGALQRRDEPRPVEDVVREDVARIRAVREAVGPGPRLYIDANCSLDPLSALELARAAEPYDISFFEEPVTQNDVALLADLRRQQRIPLACGQNEGLAWRFRDLLAARAVDVLQPNVAIGGGYTQCARIAGMASAFNVPIANGGAWPHHNMHLHAGLANGGLVEYHYVAVEAVKQFYTGLPQPEAGWLHLPEAPGLGFELDQDALRRLAALPTSQGRGKG